MSAEIQEGIDELQVNGQPGLCTVGFTSIHLLHQAVKTLETHRVHTDFHL